MRIRIALTVLVLSAVIAPVGVHAQLRGMLKKKADEVLKGKPASPPATETGKEAPTTPATPAAPASTPTSTPAPTTGSSPAARTADAKTPPADPLDVSQMNLQSTANQTLHGEMTPKKGDWDDLPYINQKTVVAAKALDDTARVALVQKLGAAFKALVMSDTYQSAHAAYVKSQFNAVDHGIKGLVSLDELMAKNNVAGMQAVLGRQQAAAMVAGVDGMSPAEIQSQLDDDMKGWARRAADPARKDRARYQKFVKDGEALKSLGASDVVKLRRGFATLRSADNDGPDTEAALYAMAARAKDEDEQLAFDQHTLKNVLRQQLTTFVAVVPTVDFAAATTQKGGKTLFVNSGYEAKGQVWKACFRAGKASSMAALAFAQAWLKEL